MTAIQKAREALETALNSIGDLIVVNGQVSWAAVARIQDEIIRDVAALDALDAETEGWRTMDSAPKDGTHILLRVPQPGGFYYAVEGAFLEGDWHSALGDHANPTHWAPKPNSIRSALVTPEERS